MARGFVYLVGAGPGNPGLITLRAREVLGRADAVVYDQLVHPGVLEWAPPRAERLCMGKVGHAHQVAQEEITAVLLERARDGQVVVRLKGGDPSIFGRVAEEALALVEAGIPIEIVPGVTAASGASAYAGIPLTHRDLAPWTTFLTGHRRKDSAGDPALKWTEVGGPAGTLVVYMGVKHLNQMVDGLTAGGWESATPVAVVRRATWPDQTVVDGTLGDIVARVAEAGLTAPAVVIVGEVVRLRSKLAWFEKRPLRGKRVLVTRSTHQAHSLSELLREAGAVALELPLIELRPAGHASGVAACLRKLFAYDWVVFSSVNAVEFTFRKLEELGLDARAFGAARVCAIGPKTAESLVRQGIRADSVPAEYVAESLVASLRGVTDLAGASILIPRAREAREVIPEELRKLGARVDVLVMYENVRPAEYPEASLHALGNGEVDLVTLASSSAARHYAELCRERCWDLQRVPCAVIGPATRQTAEELGIPVLVTAERYTVEGLVEAISDHLSR